VTSWRINHICFEVEHMEATASLLQRILCIPSAGISTITLDNANGSVQTTFFHLEQGSIELSHHDLHGSWENSPLNRRPGFHHVSFQVPDLGNALAELAGKGVEPLPDFPMDTPHGRIAFLNPDHTGEILIELRED